MLQSRCLGVLACILLLGALCACSILQAEPDQNTKRITELAQQAHQVAQQKLEEKLQQDAAGIYEILESAYGNCTDDCTFYAAFRYRHDGREFLYGYLLNPKEDGSFSVQEQGESIGTEKLDYQSK